MSALRAAAVRADITKSDGSIHDPLYAKVLVFDDGSARAAVISIDGVCLGGGIGDLSDRFFPDLRAALRAYGVSVLMCGTTHSHTPGRMLCPEDTLLTRVSDAVRDAVTRLEPATVGSGVGHDDSFLINRTLPLKDGSAWTIRQAHPLPDDRDIAGIADADDAINVLRVDRADGSPLCILFTFGCHPLLGYADNGVTAGYPGVAERIVEETFPGSVAMLLQSSGGDVTEADYKDYDHPKCCDGPGMTLGLATLRAVRKIVTADAALDSIRVPVTFPRRTDIPGVREKLLRERETLLAALGNCPLNFKQFLPLYIKYLTSPEYPLAPKYAYLREEQRGISQLTDQDAINRRNLSKYLANVGTMEKLAKIASTLETLAWHEEYNRASGEMTVDGEVLGLRIGETVLLSTPVELLTEVGRKVLAASPFERTFLVAYANGYMHYGAPADAYNNGGYETIECFLGAEWERIYLDAASKALAELHARKA
ncbi:MAG: hypothetical protein ACOXZM_01725 [Eubacteriales bacterium]